jgi:hypothetical protein
MTDGNSGLITCEQSDFKQGNRTVADITGGRGMVSVWIKEEALESAITEE